MLPRFHAHLFILQSESDAILDDVACMVGCTRSNLNVVASGYDSSLYLSFQEYWYESVYIFPLTSIGHSSGGRSHMPLCTPSTHAQKRGSWWGESPFKMTVTSLIAPVWVWVARLSLPPLIALQVLLLCYCCAAVLLLCVFSAAGLLCCCLH